ncbi:hypothetical protein K8T06_04180, partial [bacterium]|nr:hypothetical protein [bacterium]
MSRGLSKRSELRRLRIKTHRATNYKDAEIVVETVKDFGRCGRIVYRCFLTILMIIFVPGFVDSKDQETCIAVQLKNSDKIQYYQSKEVEEMYGINYVVFTRFNGSVIRFDQQLVWHLKDVVITEEISERIQAEDLKAGSQFVIKSNRQHQKYSSTNTGIQSKHSSSSHRFSRIRARDWYDLSHITSPFYRDLIEAKLEEAKAYRKEVKDFRRNYSKLHNCIIGDKKVSINYRATYYIDERSKKLEKLLDKADACEKEVESLINEFQQKTGKNIIEQVLPEPESRKARIFPIKNGFLRKKVEDKQDKAGGMNIEAVLWFLHYKKLVEKRA